MDWNKWIFNLKWNIFFNNTFRTKLGIVPNSPEIYQMNLAWRGQLLSSSLISVILYGLFRFYSWIGTRTLGEDTQLSILKFHLLFYKCAVRLCNVHYYPNRNSLFCWNDTNILENNLFKAYNSERSSYLLPVIYSLTIHMRKLIFNISRMISTEIEKPCFLDFPGVDF